VLRELSPREREVESRDGRWHMMRLRPYRTIDDRINGVVVTFVDITEHREATALLRESEERFRAFVRASSDAIYRMTPDWSEMRKLGGRGLPAEAEDPRQNWADDYVLSEDLARFRESVAAAIRDKQSFALEHRVRLPDGSIGWILSRAVPIFGEDGEIIEWFGTASDITERRRSEEALREARDALALATQASRLGWGTWNFASGSAVWDDRGREILGLREDEDRIDDWFARIVPEDREAVPREIAACARENRPFELDYGVEHRDGSVHQILGTGTFDSDAEGHPTRGTGLVRDVTDMRRWEESQRLLVGELNHRVKNMLAVVQSIAQQTQRSSDSIEAFTEALGRRIQALAAAHGLLTRQNWTGANLGELVEAAAVTFTDPHDDDRLRIDGPRLNLRPDVVITFAMAIHELGTNSMKHGALSVPEGRVAVTWTAGDGGVAFDWIETGGPPVAPPVRKGFGTRLLERGIARELEGSAHLDYREEGFRFHLEFPVNGFFRPT
jgi:two-component system CheB/CheR fusion protein